MIASEEPELPASVRVAENSDELEVIFEHCGLPRLRTLKRVCRLWVSPIKPSPGGHEKLLLSTSGDIYTYTYNVPSDESDDEPFADDYSNDYSDGNGGDW